MFDCNRETANRNPQLLLEHLTWTSGLY